MIPRRRMIASGVGSFASLALLLPAYETRSAALAPTPSQTAGPFYPQTVPPDSDNDLVQVFGHRGTANGTVTHIIGRVLDPTGGRIAGARVEIWQCDANGRYHYVRDDRADRSLD